MNNLALILLQKLYEFRDERISCSNSQETVVIRLRIKIKQHTFSFAKFAGHSQCPFLLSFLTSPDGELRDQRHSARRHICLEVLFAATTLYHQRRIKDIAMIPKLAMSMMTTRTTAYATQPVP